MKIKICHETFYEHNKYEKNIEYIIHCIKYI